MKVYLLEAIGHEHDLVVGVFATDSCAKTYAQGIQGEDADLIDWRWYTGTRQWQSTTHIVGPYWHYLITEREVQHG